MTLPALGLAIAAALAAAAPPGGLRVECEGPVEWAAGEDGASRLILSGGVRLTRGRTVLRARAAEALLSKGAASPELVRAEGDVALDAPGFSVRAGAAEMRAVPPPEGEEESAPPSYEVRLERRGRAEVELRAGDILVACLGPLTYAARSREARLTGGVRAKSPRFRARCEEAAVVFAEPRAGSEEKTGAGPEEEEGDADATRDEPPPSGQEADAGGSGAPQEGDGVEDATAEPGADEAEEEPEEKEEPPARPPAVERVDLAGGVVVETPGKDEKSSRRVRAARAVHDALTETVAFTGVPAPVVEFGGVALTAPEIVLHLRENRIEPRGGRMRAVIGPKE